MWAVLFIYPVVLAADVMTLTIDSQLGSKVEDCFDRISIGEKFPNNVIYRNVSELTMKECEQICKQDIQCQAYDYGVGAKGNATCNLSRLDEKQLKPMLVRHPDFDVYVRRVQCDQTPPLPIQASLYDAGESSAGEEIPEVLSHRPIHRPEVEDPRRPSDNNLPDLKPYETNLSEKPYKPYANYGETPDDRPPSYGAFSPQNIPFRPDSGSFPAQNGPYLFENRPYGPHHGPHNRPYHPQVGHYHPENIPYHPESGPYDVENRPYYPENRPDQSPNRPYRPQYGFNQLETLEYGSNQPHNHVQISRPDKPNHIDHSDVLHFQGQYRPYLTNYRPDPYYPSGQDEFQDIYGQRPRPEQPYRPQNQDINRPIKRPEYQRPNQIPDNSGYGSKPEDYPAKPENDGPINPPDRPYKPNRPYYVNKPDYPNQFENGYGQTQNFHHGETYKPNRPTYGSNDGFNQNYGGGLTGYGYGYVNQKQQTYHKPSNTNNHHGYGTITEIDHNNNHYTHKPQSSNGDKPQMPYNQNYDNNHDNNQNYINGNHGSSSQNSQPQNGYIKPSNNHYGINQNSDNNQSYRPQTPTTNRPTPKPQNGFRIQASYHQPQSNYFNNQNYQKPTYENQPLNGEDKPPQNNPSYGGKRPSTDEPLFENDRPDPTYNNQPTSDNHQHQSNGYDNLVEDNKNIGNQKPNHNHTNHLNQVKPVYEHEKDRPANAPNYVIRPGEQVVISRPVAIGDYGSRPEHLQREPRPSYKACFRRVLAGRRTLRSYVQRVVPCERLEDCRRECAEERRFHCESFNYRLDPAFRGKGLCELMTKPIEAFNIRRDFVEDKNYDFYELDRNSLEPHCPETLKGPGFLHSGYLSSRSSSAIPVGDSWSSRDGFQDRDFDYRDHNRFYDDHRDRDRSPGKRRYPQEPYVPYQISTGRNDDHDRWGRYGGVYGGYDSYYKNRNEYHKSIDHWRINDIEPHYGVKPYSVKPYGHDFNYHDLGHGVKPYGVKSYGHESFNYHDLGHGVKPYGVKVYGHDSFNSHDLGKNIWDRYGGSWKRGRWDNVGTTGLDYGESNYYHPPEPHHEYHESAEGRDEPDSDAIVKDCTSRRRPGMSLSSGSIRRSLLTRNVVECESACFNEREFRCVSYSFRYSNSRGTDNCFLSERPYKGLDLAADSGSDVYAMQDHGCNAVSHKTWVENECFWHVRSGATVSGEVAKAAITAAGLGACEAECIRAQGFFCRGFSFRFDPPVTGDDLENCILTSSPPTSLDNGRGLRPTVGHELYARGNYGRGCEPALYDDVHVHEDEYECYLQYDNAAKLIGPAVKGQAHTKEEQACGKACTNAPFRCLSFSFNNNAPPDKDNCLLSEIRLFDLQRGVDYEHSADYWLFAFDLFNSGCHRKVVLKDGYEPPIEIPHAIPPRPEDPYKGPAPSGPPVSPGYFPVAPSGPAYIPESGPPSGTGYRPYPEDHGFKPSYPPRPYPPEDKPYPDYLPAPPRGPSYIPDPGFSAPSEPESYRPSRPLPPGGTGPSDSGYPERHPDPGYSGGGGEVRPIGPGDRGEPIAVSWKHYTVSGLPCRQGTTCAQNQVSGHWACEPEGGEIGSWDYCCAPSHRCGYSEGFHKPWCYVGLSEDQWRPCSEKYYPYHQHNVPHPSQGHREEGHHRPSNTWQGSYYGPRPRPYLPEDDRRYWDELYKNGPKAYYDQYGNPLPGYSRVPMADRPHIRYHHNYPQPEGGPWVPVPQDFEPSQPELGTARYWPVAYLHKGPPPNMTYYKYKDTHTTTTEKYIPTPLSLPNKGPSTPFYTSKESNKTNDRGEKNRNMTTVDKDLLSLVLDFASLNLTNSTAKSDGIELTENMKKDSDSKLNDTQVELIKQVTTEKSEKLKGISGKIDDFSGSIEILDIEDAKKGEKKADLKTLEAEEQQIEAIGRLLASRRDGKLVIEKRSQKDFESKNIALDKELLNFNFGNKFPASTNERKGIVQKVTKEQIERDKNTDKSLELSETTFVRPPRVLSTTTTEKTEVRKAIVNGKIFYDATLNDKKDKTNVTTTTKGPKTLRPLEERAPTAITNASYGRKSNVRPRNANPVRKVRRVYRRRYNPGEVRKRLLEKERYKQDINADNRKTLS